MGSDGGDCWASSRPVPVAQATYGGLQVLCRVVIHGDLARGVVGGLVVADFQPEGFEQASELVLREVVRVEGE